VQTKENAFDQWELDSQECVEENGVKNDGDGD